MEQDDRRILLERMGTFFILVGLGLLLLFVASDLGEATYFRYFFFGTASMAVGWFLRRAGAPPPKPSQRFAALRRAMEKQREAQEKKIAELKAKQQKK